MISFLRYWLPLLIWMVVIFSASADTQSTAHTSRFLEPFLRWFWSDISPEKIDQVRWVVRKTAHLTEFAILAWLWWRALRRPTRHDSNPWSWRIAGYALGAVILYAISDESHQYFVANRTASVRDVGIDTLGGMIGIGFLWMNYRKRA
jgi:VanZ family protein